MADNIDYNKSIYEIFVDVNKSSLSGLKELSKTAEKSQAEMSKLSREIERLAKELDNLSGKKTRNEVDDRRLVQITKELRAKKELYNAEKRQYDVSSRQISDMDRAWRSFGETLSRVSAQYNKLKEIGGAVSPSVQTAMAGRGAIQSIQQRAMGATDTAQIVGLTGQLLRAENNINTALDARTSKIKRNAQLAREEEQASRRADAEKRRNQARDEASLNRINNLYDRLLDKLNRLREAEDRSIATGAQKGYSDRYINAAKSVSDFQASIAAGNRDFENMRANARQISSDIVAATGESRKQTAKVVSDRVKQERLGQKQIQAGDRERAALERRLDRDTAQAKWINRKTLAKRIADYERLLATETYRNDVSLQKKLADLKQAYNKVGGRAVDTSFGSFEGIVKGALVGRIVREIFDSFRKIYDIYKNLIKTAFDFNVQLRETQIGLAAVIAQGQKIMVNGAETTDIQTKYTASLGLAKDMQKEMLVVANRSILTYTELNDTMMQASALLSSRGVALEDQVQLASKLLTAEKAIGVQQQQMFIEMKQVMMGDVVRGQLARQLVAAGKVSIDQLKNLYGKELVRVLTSALQEFEAAGVRRMETIQGKWEIFTDTMKFQLATVFDNPELKHSVITLLDNLMGKFFTTVRVGEKDVTVLTSEGKDLVNTLTIIVQQLTAMAGWVSKVFSSRVISTIAAMTAGFIACGVAVIGVKIALDSARVASEAFGATLRRTNLVIGLISIGVGLLSGYLYNKLMPAVEAANKGMVEINGNLMKLDQFTIGYAANMAKRGDALNKYFATFQKYQKALQEGKKLNPAEEKEFREAVVALNAQFPTLIENTKKLTHYRDLDTTALSNNIAKMRDSIEVVREQIAAQKEMALAMRNVLGMQIQAVLKNDEFVKKTMGLNQQLVNLANTGAPGTQLLGWRKEKAVDLYAGDVGGKTGEARTENIRRAIAQLSKDALDEQGNLKKNYADIYADFRAYAEKYPKDAIGQFKAYFMQILMQNKDFYDKMTPQQQVAATAFSNSIKSIALAYKQAYNAGIDFDSSLKSIADSGGDLSDQFREANKNLIFYTKLAEEVERRYPKPKITTSPAAPPPGEKTEKPKSEELSREYYIYEAQEKILSDMVEDMRRMDDLAKKETQTQQVKNLQTEYDRLRKMAEDFGSADYEVKAKAIQSQLQKIFDDAAAQSTQRFLDMWKPIVDGIKSQSPEIGAVLEKALSSGVEEASRTKYQALINKLGEQVKGEQALLARTQEALAKESAKAVQDKQLINTLQTQETKQLNKINELNVQIGVAQAAQASNTKDLVREREEYLRQNKVIDESLDTENELMHEMTIEVQALANAWSYFDGTLQHTINRLEDIQQNVEDALAKLDLEGQKATAEFEKGKIGAAEYGAILEKLRIAKIEELEKMKKALVKAQLEINVALATQVYDDEQHREAILRLRELENQVKEVENEILGLQTAMLTWGRAAIGVFGELIDVVEMLGGTVPEQVNQIYTSLNSLLEIYDKLQKGDMPGFSAGSGFGDVFGKLFSGAGGIAGILTSAMSAVPIVGAIASIATGIISGLNSLFTRAARQIAKEMRKELSDIMNDYQAGENTLAKTLEELERTRQEAIDRLSGKKGGQKELEQLLPEFDQAIAQLRDEQRKIFESFEDKLKLLRLDEFLRDTQSSFDDIIKTYKEYIDAGGDVTKANEFLTLSFADMRRELQEELDQETEDFNEQWQREMDNWLKGAEDELGRLISLEEKAAQDIDNIRDEYDKAHAERLKNIAQAEADLATFIKDKTKEIEDIKNEGVAERRKSTQQDKLDRIAAIQDEMRNQRIATNERIQQIQEEDAAAKEAADNAVTRIQNQLERQRQAHEEALAQLEEESLTRINQLQQELAFLQQLIDEYYALAEAVSSVVLPPIAGGGQPVGGGSGVNDTGTTNPHTNPWNDWMNDVVGWSNQTTGLGQSNYSKMGGEVKNFDVTVNVTQADATPADIERAVISAITKVSRSI